MKPLVFSLLLMGGASVAPAQNVIISEFLADNDTTLKNEYGEDADWLEIYNADSVAVDLAGWSLKDGSATWVFPSYSLAPGAYLVVFADDRNLKVAGHPYHTNFGLSKGGEYLGLLRPNGTIASEYATKFPAQVTDVSYGIPQSSTATVVAQGAAGQVGVPTSATDFTDNFVNWKTTATNLTGTSWQTVTTGVGFDDPEAAYGTLISATGEISARMRNQQRTACLRVPFTITNPANVTSLKLRMKYDDGFIAWINGVQVAADAAPASPAWNSLGTLNRTESLNNGWTEFTIPVSAVTLQAGTNILAIQGFNITTASSDFLLLPELDVTSSIVGGAATYFVTPTPGAANGVGGPIGPIISPATTTIPRPLGTGSSPAATVSVTVTNTVNNVSASTVKMYYRTMFGTETAVTMTAGSGGVYTATLPTTGPTAGQMLRWRFEAADVSGNIGRAPVYRDPLDNDQYYGTVAVNAAENSSQLPILHQFISDTAAADTRAGTRCSLFYLNRFYDNVEINLHGQTSAGFAKKSVDLDFNGDNRFTWKEDAARTAKDINLLSNYADKTKFRNTLAQEVAMKALAPYHFAFPVRVQRNAAFQGVFDMVEDGDDRMLERNGLNPDGALYKMYDALVSASTAEKKTRKEETGTADLQALITGLNTATPLATRRTFAYDNVNIPAAVNYLAAARRSISEGRPSPRVSPTPSPPPPTSPPARASSSPRIPPPSPSATRE